MGELVAGTLALCSIGCVGLSVSHARRGRTMAPLGRPEGELLEGSRRRFPALSIRSVLVPASVLGWILGWRVAGLSGALAAAVAAIAVPRIVARRRLDRRREALDGSVGDAVSSIGSALRAGMSLPQALAHAGRETTAPLGPLLTQVADRASLGAPMDAALAELIKEVHTSDMRLVVGVLRLHRRTGGALPTALDELARTLRERRSDAREIRSLTAQARLSATILGLLPVGFFLFLSITSRSDIEAAARTAAGATAIALGLGLQGAAYLWIRHLLRVEA